MSIQYRPEIDGLRAVAVLAVLFAHANVVGFAGGFVGVDVFFVISGFLITSLIVKDLKAGAFSFVDFWERRIRRILPPLSVVIVTTLIAGWFLYLPSDYSNLGKQVAAQSVFGSNILFKMQAGYFDTSNIIKPLLHTWSLAVEEQFYFFFPLAAFLIWKYRQEKAFKYFVVFTVISFVAAAFLVRNSPSSAFYLLPFRAWELMIGALLVLKPVHLQGRAKEAVGWAGFGFILLAVFFYTEEIMFPGVTALLPCLGAGMIIASNTGGLNTVGKILSMRGPVFIGLVSYSLYLWHWPILAFARYSELFPFSWWVAALCLGGSFSLAVLSWKFVETPFRKKKILKTAKQAYLGALAFIIFMALSGLTISYLKGVPSRLDKVVVQYAAGEDDINPHREECNKPDFKRFETGDLCQSNPGKDIKPSFVLWGDSHADAIASSFYDLSGKYNRNGYVVTAHGCGPVLDYQLKGYDGFDCVKFNNLMLEFIRKNGIKHVFLVASWDERLKNDEAYYKNREWFSSYKEDFSDISMAALKRTVDEVQSSGAKVYIMKNVPIAPYDPPRFLAMHTLYSADTSAMTLERKAYEASRAAAIDSFEKMTRKSGIVFIDPIDTLCDEMKCNFAVDGHSLYFNKGHLSNYGARYLNSLFAPYFKKDF